jgi:hypothetical protein
MHADNPARQEMVRRHFETDTGKHDCTAPTSCVPKIMNAAVGSVAKSEIEYQLPTLEYWSTYKMLARSTENRLLILPKRQRNHYIKHSSIKIDIVAN